MKKKYEKPLSQNLGYMIPDAMGNCSSGSSAGTLRPCGGGSVPGNIEHCGPGQVANGACNNGIGAVGKACAAGTGIVK
jgi:hypothetical protein